MLYIEEVDDKQLVYFPHSLKFFLVNAQSANVLEMMDKGNDYSKIKAVYPDFRLEEYNRFLAIMQSDCALNCDEIPKNILSRLVVNISNVCNLDCKYCYANGGNYSSENALMTEDVLIKTLDVFFEIFDEIGLIQLFGGEPTLNIDLIKAAGKYVSAKNKNTLIGFVTNGTIMPDELIDAIREFKISVTLSLDCSTLHDALRPYKDGTGTYKKILENMKRLKAQTSQPSQVEVTYTNEHILNGISVLDVIKSVHQDVGVPIHLVPVVSEDGRYKIDDVTPFTDSIKEWFALKNTNDKFLYSYIERFVIPLKKKIQSKRFCNAGIGTLAVSTNGTIYPCFYFVDNQTFEMGNIYEEVCEIRNKIDSTREKYQSFNFDDNKKCKGCFAKTICYGCLGINYFETGSEFESSEFRCRLVREGLLQCVRGFSKEKTK